MGILYPDHPQQNYPRRNGMNLYPTVQSLDQYAERLPARPRPASSTYPPRDPRSSPPRDERRQPRDSRRDVVDDRTPDDRRDIDDKEQSRRERHARREARREERARREDRRERRRRESLSPKRRPRRESSLPRDIPPPPRMEDKYEDGRNDAQGFGRIPFVPDEKRAVLVTQGEHQRSLSPERNTGRKTPLPQTFARTDSYDSRYDDSEVHKSETPSFNEKANANDDEWQYQGARPTSRTHKTSKRKSSSSPRQYATRTDSYDSRYDDEKMEMGKRYYQRTADDETAYKPAARDESDDYKPSAYDEAEYYRYNNAPEPRYQREKKPWSRRRKLLCFGLVPASIILLIIIIAVAVVFSQKSSYNYTPSTAQVNNTAAFTNGGATHNPVSDLTDGIGAGADTYTYYSGNASQFPTSDKWVSFGDMWNKNLNTIQNSCTWLKEGENNTPKMVQDIYDSIQSRANASLVDHRYILATILQESAGCVRVGHTTSSSGVKNPGLMQSHNGHSFSSSHVALSILAMVQDGTQGTKEGNGLVQNLDTYGNVYSASRGYNSGYVPTNGNLSEAAGATACYVSDIANRLTGWVNAKSTCPGDTA